MPERYEDALRVLGLEPGAPEQAIQDAYRDLVQVWHPDRFGSDARLRAKAHDKLKEVNAAFEQLRGYSASEFRPPREPAPPGDRRNDRPRVAEPSLEHARDGRTRNAVVLLFSAALIGFVGTGLFMSRSCASRPLVPASEQIQTPPPVSSTRVPTTRQPVRQAPEESPSRVVQPTTGSLIVASRPLGARVSFDGRVVGETPIHLTDVTPGEHHVEVTLGGTAYQPWSSSVVVTAGQDEKLLAVMTPAARGR